MNRLEAARYLHNNHLIFQNGDGTYMVLIHVTKSAAEDWEVQPGLYYYNAPVGKLGACPRNLMSWHRAKWQEVRKLLTSAYPQRHPHQCEHKHESGARCMYTKDDHNHCKKCGEAHMHHHLCFTCQISADKVRLDITRQMAAYYNTYGIPFQKDEDTYDHMTGAFDDYDDLPRSRGDREDFHADG